MGYIDDKDKKLNEEANNTNNGKLNGVDDATQEKMNSSYVQSDESKKADADSDKALSNLGSLTSKNNIISNDVKKDLNSSFKTPSAVTEADTYLASQLEKIQSGKTSYSDQVRDLMDKITNRDKFSYDVDTDPLFQQALASAMNSGKQAMQDTIGQASALTGGYGSTYATSAGNQAYNSFIEDAYDNLPQYYQMAKEADQMEIENLYRQFGMYSEADDKEYNRNLMAYDATYQHRNQMYNEAYTQYRDTKSDAFAMANLQLTEHGQKVSDAYNYYNATSNNANTMYEREYGKWADEVNQATQYAQMLNSDYWSKTNFDEGVREYEKSFAENVRQYDTSFAENQRQFNESLAEQKRQHNEQMSYNWTALNRSSSGGNSQSGGLELSTSQFNAAKAAYDTAGGGQAGTQAAIDTLAVMGVSIDDNNAPLLMDALEANTAPQSTTKTGAVSEFRTVKGDNFNVKVTLGDGKEQYLAVENHGKVDNGDVVKELKNVNAKNGEAFVYNGDAYVKYADGYYKIGAMVGGGKNYQNLLKALQN